MKLLDFIYTLLGQGIVFIIILIIILFIIAITLGKILLKKNIIIFPRFILFVVDVFYSPFKTIARLLKIDDDMIDRISIEVRDDVNKEKFKKIPAEETLIFLPHCLRHRDCQAALQKEGVICTECGKCSIELSKKRQTNWDTVYILFPDQALLKK